MNISRKFFSKLLSVIGICLLGLTIGIFFQPTSTEAFVPCEEDKCINNLCVGGYPNQYCDIDPNTQECETKCCDPDNEEYPCKEEG